MAVTIAVSTFDLSRPAVLSQSQQRSSFRSIHGMGKRMVERRLRQSSTRLKALREELRVIDEQLAMMTDEAGDKGIRALVSETPGAGAEYRDAQAQADAMARSRAHVAASIGQLEARQDELLDQLQRA